MGVKSKSMVKGDVKLRRLDKLAYERRHTKGNSVIK